MPPRKRKPVVVTHTRPDGVFVDEFKPTDEERYESRWHDEDGNPVYHQESPKPV